MPRARPIWSVSSTAMRAMAAVTFDPELGLDVVSLGLVYALEVRDGEAFVDLTMTSAACPLGDHIVREAEAGGLPAGAEVEVLPFA